MQGEGYSIGTFERTFKFLLVFMESNACRACVQRVHSGDFSETEGGHIFSIAATLPL